MGVLNNPAGEDFAPDFGEIATDIEAGASDILDGSDFLHRVDDLVDLHCHILPGIDDGARDLKEAVAMAHMARADGVGLVVATPHFHPGVHDNPPEAVAAAAVDFSRILTQGGLDLELRWAAEARLGPSLLGRFKQGRLALLNSAGPRRFLLLEFPYGGPPPGGRYMVDLLMRAGVTPVLAHPERIRPFRRDPDALTPFMRMGCLVQITAGSLCGEFGPSARRSAEALLERGWVQVIASDGHGFHRRQPVLRDGLRAAARAVGPERALRMARDNPRAILEGEFEP